MRKLRYYPGIIVVFLLLLWISATAIKPDLYLIGWDNYSSYLGGLGSIWRTLFSTWRAYRGIGVPSDSESVDLVRQLIILVISPFTHESIRDQLYMLACLWIGILSTYFLTRRIIQRHVTKDERLADVAAGAAAIVYGLNLNTLATFYFPIITYITRYASLPLLLLVFDQWMYNLRHTWFLRIGFVAAILFSMGSFLTATVFVTTCVFLFIFVAFQGKWKRGMIAFAIFILLNAFWLLPFGNYAVEKSAVLRLAPAFIDTNEAQFNLAPSSFGILKQLVLYPNFFDTRYTAIDTSRPTAFHPATDMVSTPFGIAILMLFPIGAILAMCTIVARRQRHLLWIPAIYMLFVLLATQEYTPLGFIPAFLNRYVPYFQVVFRFGDTKFHPYMAVTGALAFGLVILECIRLFKHRTMQKAGIILVYAVILIVPLATVFRAYISGNFLPDYLFVRLPPAYRTVAKTINADTVPGRVLHLPYDPKLYWRSYAWGYMGSAFFQYLLNKPYLDKTFEPASLETTDFFTALSAKIGDANEIVGGGAQKQAQEVLRLLQEYGVTWIVDDTSVTPELGIRNIRYWGSFNTTDAETVLKSLEASGDITRVMTVPIDLTSIANQYKQAVTSEETAGLVLYKINKPYPMIQFSTRTISIDPLLTRTPAWPALQGDSVQSSGNTDSVVYPFLYKDAIFSTSDKGFELRHNLTLPVNTTSDAVVSSRSGVGRAVRVTIARSLSEAIVRLYELPFPEMNGILTQKLMQTIHVPLSQVPDLGESMLPADAFVSNWHIVSSTSYSPLRLVVDDIVLPVPPITDQAEHMIGSVLVTHNNPTISVLRFSTKEDLRPDRFLLTDDPNCFNDKLDGYNEGLTTRDALTIRSQNGSTCVVGGLAKADHIEIALDYTANSQDDPTDQPGRGVSSKPAVTNYLTKLAKPNYLNLCLSDSDPSGCANLHQMVNLSRQGVLIVPGERITGGPLTFRLGLIPVGKESQTITFSRMTAYHFTAVKTEPLEEPGDVPQSEQIRLSSPLTLTIPPLLSRGSYYGSQTDGLFTTNRPCEQSGGFRTTRTVNENTLSYLERCYSELSVQVPFDSNVPKLWLTPYIVYSGKYPQMKLGDPFSHYVDEYLSLYEGYPNVPNMLQLEAPQQWYRMYQNTTISRILHNSETQFAYTWVPSRPELTDTRTKFYTIHQDSLNEGIFAVGQQSIVEYPAGWQDLQITLGNPSRMYKPVTHYTWQEMLPSLIRVSVNDSASLGDRLLLQRVGYDRQWRLYPSLIDLLMDRHGVVPDRCDGFANCYSVPQAPAYFLLYTPERLAILGWFITLGTVASLILIRSKKTG